MQSGESVTEADRFGNGELPLEPMLVGVHDHHVPGDLTVTTNRHLALRNDFHVAIEIRPIADPDARAGPAFETHTGEECAVLHLDGPSEVAHPYPRKARLTNEKTGPGELPPEQHTEEQACQGMLPESMPRPCGH